MCVTNIKPCNFLTDSVMWEPLFYFLDKETETAEGNYLRLYRLQSYILIFYIYIYIFIYDIYIYLYDIDVYIYIQIYVYLPQIHTDR